MHFDDAILECGQFGFYQKRLVVMLMISELMVAMHTLSPVYLAYTPDHWCEEPEMPTNTNCSHEQIMDFSIPKTDEGYLSCKRYDRPYVNLTDEEVCPDGRSIFPNATTGLGTVKCERWSYDQSNMINTAVTTFNLVCGKASLGSSIGGIFLGANIVGYFFFGVLADKFGRKPIMIFGNFTSLVFGLIHAFMPNISGFLITRALLAIAISAKGSGSIILGLEFVGPKYRVLVGSLLGAMWASNYHVVTLFAYLTRRWRILQVVLSVPEVLIIPFLLVFIDESPRWLITRGRDEEAHKILDTVAKRNGREMPKDAKVVIEEQHNESLIEMFKYKSLTIITIIVGIGWFADGFVYYGLAFTTPALGSNPFMNIFLMGLVEVPASLFILVLFTYVGRIVPMSASYLISGVSLLLTMAIPIGQMNGLMIFLVLMGKLFIMMSYCMIWIYCNELYPTSIRSSAVSVCYAITRVSSLAGSYLGLLNNVSPYLAPAICGFAGLISGILVLGLPETRGIKMAMTIKDGDKFIRKHKFGLFKCNKDIIVDADSTDGDDTSFFGGSELRKRTITNDSSWFTLSHSKLYLALKESKETNI